MSLTGWGRCPDIALFTLEFSETPLDTWSTLSWWRQPGPKCLLLPDWGSSGWAAVARILVIAVWSSTMDTSWSLKAALLVQFWALPLRLAGSEQDSLRDPAVPEGQDLGEGSISFATGATRSS